MAACSAASAALCMAHRARKSRWPRPAELPHPRRPARDGAVASALQSLSRHRQRRHRQHHLRLPRYAMGTSVLLPSRICTRLRRRPRNSAAISQTCMARRQLDRGNSPDGPSLNDASAADADLRAPGALQLRKTASSSSLPSPSHNSHLWTLRQFSLKSVLGRHLQFRLLTGELQTADSA